MKYFQLLGWLLVFRSHICPAYSNGKNTNAFIINFVSIRVLRCQLANIGHNFQSLPTRTFTFSVSFFILYSIYLPHRALRELNAKICVLNHPSSFPSSHFQLKSTSSTLLFLYTSSAHSLTFAASINFCSPSRVADINTCSTANQIPRC